MSDLMTKADPDELAKLVRRREKLAKADINARAADLLADFEQQLAREYDPWDAAWKEAFERAQREVQELNARIQAQMEQSGVPAKLAPSAHVRWMPRGENISAERRAELRKVAQTRIASSEKAARVQIERQSVDVQTQLVAGGLQSDEARAFLASMPTAEALMPPLSVGELDQGGGAT